MGTKNYEIILNGVSVKTCFSYEEARKQANDFCSDGDCVEIVYGNPTSDYEHVEIFSDLRDPR